MAEEERDIEKAGITHNMRNVEPGWSWRGPAFPSNKAPMMGLSVARDGRIWVKVAGRLGEIPEAERSTTDDPLAPVTKHRTPSGLRGLRAHRSLPRARRLPAAGRFAEADGDLVWAIVRDADDVPAVVRFKVTEGFR